MSLKTLIFTVPLIFIPISIAAHFLDWGAQVVFITAAIAIIPLAGWMGNATEELAVVVGPTLGGAALDAAQEAPGRQAGDAGGRRHRQHGPDRVVQLGQAGRVGRHRRGAVVGAAGAGRGERRGAARERLAGPRGAPRASSRSRP